MNVHRSTVALFLVLINALAWAQTTSLPLTDDTHIADDAGDWLQADRNYGSRPLMLVHDWGPFHALVRFDAAAISGQTVDSATLRLYLADLRAAGSISVHAITSPWTESSVTWNTGPSYEPVPETVIALGSADVGSTASIDLTDLAAKWASGFMQNHGVLLRTTEPIRAEFDTKETPGGVPAELEVMASTGPSVYAKVLDFTDPDNCTIDEPGYYVLDRGWDFASQEQSTQCEQLLVSVPVSEQIILDLRGFRIAGGNGTGVVHLTGFDTGEITLRNGEVYGSVYGGGPSLRIERLSINGRLEIDNAWALVVVSSQISDGGIGFWIDHTSRCSIVEIRNSSVSNCPDNLCIAMDQCDYTAVRDNRVSGRISLYGQGVIANNTLTFQGIGGLAGIDVIYGGATVVRNILDLQVGVGTGILVRDSGAGATVIDSNVVQRAGIGIDFALDATGNFYGNNRISATTPFVGTDGQTDWGGNVSF